jgi:outer membrane protein
MIYRLSLLALLLAAQPAIAQEAPEEEEESKWRLGAALGYGERSNPLVHGERWFFDNGDLGVTFADNSALTASVVARINSDRVFFGKTDTRFISLDLAGEPASQMVEFKPPDRDYA